MDNESSGNAATARSGDDGYGGAFYSEPFGVACILGTGCELGLLFTEHYLLHTAIARTYSETLITKQIGSDFISRVMKRKFNDNTIYGENKSTFILAVASSLHV